MTWRLGEASQRAQKLLYHPKQEQPRLGGMVVITINLVLLLLIIVLGLGESSRTLPRSHEQVLPPAPTLP